MPNQFIEEKIKKFKELWKSPKNTYNDFENFIRQSLELQRDKFIDELETNPNEDGSISPNIQHWIEAKQRQLRKYN